MPNERAARGDFLAAAEHIRKLMSITDEIDDLIPCGWLSKEEAAQIRAIPEFLFRCVLDEHPMVRTLRDTVDLPLAIFNEDRVAAVLWEDHRIAKAREVIAFIPQSPTITPVSACSIAIWNQVPATSGSNLACSAKKRIPSSAENAVQS